MGQVFRQVAEDNVTLAGVHIPKGAIVGASVMYSQIDTRYVAPPPLAESI